MSYNKSPSYPHVVIKFINYLEWLKSSVHQIKIRTGGSLYCVGPNDHQVTSTFVKLCHCLRFLRKTVVCSPQWSEQVCNN